MAKKRTSTGKSGETVLKEYNYRCSICGSDRPQLHHIDEDPSNQDPLNLLPLCPNCHLSDQHNPTAKVEPGLLKLFRRYRDPLILSPQFVPLYGRLAFLWEAPTASLAYLLEKGNELVGFVSQLSMGQFYANKIAALLTNPTSPQIFIIPEMPEERRRRERIAEEELESYRKQVTDAIEGIKGLVVELLRYQSWFK